MCGFGGKGLGISIEALNPQVRPRPADPASALALRLRLVMTCTSVRGDALPPHSVLLAQRTEARCGGQQRRQGPLRHPAEARRAARCCRAPLLRYLCAKAPPGVIQAERLQLPGRNVVVHCGFGQAPAATAFVPAPPPGAALPTPAAAAMPAAASPAALSSTTLGLWNRERDRALVKRHLKLVEPGDEATEFTDGDGNLLARGYTRLVFGDHGCVLVLVPGYVQYLPCGSRAVASQRVLIPVCQLQLCPRCAGNCGMNALKSCRSRRIASAAARFSLLKTRHAHIYISLCCLPFFPLERASSSPSGGIA